MDDLKESLAKVEKERDYFRARADRLELMLIPQRRPAAPERPRNTQPVPMRKNWAQVVLENAAEIERKAQQAKEKEGAN